MTTATVRTSNAVMTNLCGSLRDSLAEIKGYFTEEEKDAMGAAVQAALAHGYKQYRRLQESECPAAHVMARKPGLIARFESEVLNTQLWADYQAALDHSAHND